MCDCHSLGELVQIQQRWLVRPIGRSVADAEALVSIPIALSESSTGIVKLYGGALQIRAIWAGCLDGYAKAATPVASAQA